MYLYWIYYIIIKKIKIIIMTKKEFTFMKIVRNLLFTVLGLLAAILPIFIVIGSVLIAPSQYTNTFVGALDEKYDRLVSIEESKLVVIGGSSVAFGLDSAMIEEYLDMPVVNFGLYAAIGTKAMLDLSREHIGEGDIVIVSPEMDPQTLSLYFSNKMTLEAMDGRYDMAKEFDIDTHIGMLGSFWKHASDKLNYMINGMPDPEGVYNSKNFNEYGDIDYERTENVMQFYYDPNTIIDLSPAIVEADFIDYLNEYIADCEKRGATVYFSWCPMNELALKEGTTAESMQEFALYMEENINCEFISYIDSYVLDAGYFYDTNYHLNDAGVTVRTKSLVEDLLLAASLPPVVKVPTPDAPALPLADVKYFEVDENEKYFTYTELFNGALAISGLTELGKQQTELTVPVGAQYIKVTAINPGAFAGGAATKLIIPADTYVRNFIDGCMDGSAITDIMIYYEFDDTVDQSSTLHPASDFGGVTIHIPIGSAYLTHYDWENANGFEFVVDIESGDAE